MTQPVDATASFDTNFTYSPGGPGDIVVVSLYYKWPIYVSLLGVNLQNMTGGKRLLVGDRRVPQRALRNECRAMTATIVHAALARRSRVSPRTGAASRPSNSRCCCR